MVDDSDSDEDDRGKDINVQVPSEGGDVRYTSAKIPIDQFEALDRVKDEYGMTWRGLLMNAQRELNSYPAQNIEPPDDDGKSQYQIINDTRKRHGLTWKGMLLFAARDLQQNDPVGT